MLQSCVTFVFVHVGLSPGLRSVAVQDLVGSNQVQFPVALLEHVDPRQPAGGGDQSLLHGCRVHQLAVQDGAAEQRRAEVVMVSGVGQKWDGLMIVRM